MQFIQGLDDLTENSTEEEVRAAMEEFKKQNQIKGETTKARASAKSIICRVKL